ncbi:sensor histidine kinase [Nonlabens agnitus]|uniref:sensor histidine kinase n=1 Tax=Nonlabens agnitus TaxID=870484 RepID=UPI001F5B0AD9|nr:HAMP domain-containing sensor histidine kinase [Nonlabens agnitus]
MYFIIGGAVFTLGFFINIYRYVTKRFVEMDDFFESVKYRDFSRWFVEDRGSQDMRRLHKGFNLVNRTIKEINNDRQAQFVYLQKILAMVNVGIIAFNVETGAVLWINDSFLKLLDFPSFKNISFVKSRRPEIFEELFDKYHTTITSTTLRMRQEDIEVLISDTVFEVEDTSFKLVVIQNIEDTLNHNESEAWKKLLSVMTHEIMNSIAPISSLAETLETNLKESIEKPALQLTDPEDVLAGISSIKKRSEGLMKFAQTYRSLNKVTHLNRTEVYAKDLLDSIQNLLQPSIKEKEVKLEFEVSNPKLQLEIDSYLIEQVLINLIVNAIEATEDFESPQVMVQAMTNSKGNIQIIIRDNGSGIPAEIMESVFVPFFSTKNRGSGIGLSLSKQIMTLHQGKIQLRNLEPRGTEARLIF